MGSHVNEAYIVRSVYENEFHSKRSYANPQFEAYLKSQEKKLPWSVLSGTVLWQKLRKPIQ